MPLSAGAFYETYHGHEIEHLETLHTELRQAGHDSFAFLAGDSSLDNKHWFFKEGSKRREVENGASFVANAINGYEQVLQPPHMVQDVAYWLNKELKEHGSSMACINCAVEESCINLRESKGLLPQDVFIRDHLTEEDVLIVDVGGNDVALHPTLGVILNMAWLIYLTPKLCIQWGPLLAPGLLFFINMFGSRLRSYIEKLTEKCKPRKVIICMLYFLDEKSGGSWADQVLEKLGYNSDPTKLQEVMRQVYAWGVTQISIPGTLVAPLPLYEYLDGKDHSDYEQRVEPSVTGGRKMAHAMAQKIFG
jgi:hypothetical protein